MLWQGHFWILQVAGNGIHRGARALCAEEDVANLGAQRIYKAIPPRPRGHGQQRQIPFLSKHFLYILEHCRQSIESLDAAQAGPAAVRPGSGTEIGHRLQSGLIGEEEIGMKGEKCHHHQTDADGQKVAEHKELIPVHRDSVHSVDRAIVWKQLVLQSGDPAEKEREPRIGTRLYAERLEEGPIAHIAVKEGARPEPKQKHIEIAVVSVSDTVPHPRTVMVHLQNTTDHTTQRHRE